MIWRVIHIANEVDNKKRRADVGLLCLVEYAKAWEFKEALLKNREKLKAFGAICYQLSSISQHHFSNLPYVPTKGKDYCQNR